MTNLSQGPGRFFFERNPSEFATRKSNSGRIGKRKIEKNRTPRSLAQSVANQRVRLISRGPPGERLSRSREIFTGLGPFPDKFARKSGRASGFRGIAVAQAPRSFFFAGRAEPPGSRADAAMLRRATFPRPFRVAFTRSTRRPRRAISGDLRLDGTGARQDSCWPWTRIC